MSQNKNFKGFVNSELVVSVEEARKLLAKDNVIFIDTRNYWKYVKGHIPGAFNLELYAFHWIDTSKEGIGAFVRQMELLLSSIGIDERKNVIFYQNNSGYDAARGVWLLNYLGHKNASLLDGGLNLWKRKAYPLSTKDPEKVNRSEFHASLDESLVATLDDVSQKLGKNATRILDARSQGEYDGTYRRALKLGHVLGAFNIEWKKALRKDGTLKNADTLRKLYSKSIDQESEIVTYCQSGYRAAHTWLVLKLLGFDHVRNYLGSWYEWGNSPKTPVTRTG